MDSHTLQILEFDKIRSLLVDHSVTSLGKELAAAAEPAAEIEHVRREIALTTEMAVAFGQGHHPPFGGVSDVRLLVRRASIGSMLSAEQLLEIAQVLSATGGFYRYRMRLDARCGRLIDLLTPVDDLGPTAKSIAGSIDPRGHVLDMASPDLAAVRVRLTEFDERIQFQIKRMLRDPELRKALRYPNATMSGEHYVLPVAATHRHKVPGVVHRTSPTGETLFVEPAGIAHTSAERAVVKSEEEREVRRVLRRLTAEVAKLAKPLVKAIEVIAQLDLIAARAKLSREYGMTAPVMNTDGLLALSQARHPLLEHLFRTEPVAEGERRQVVPIDVRLGYAANILVITGPNTGGKTVALKTIGLLALMAQAGMHVPAADGCVLPIFDHVLADIGDEQSLEQSLSTFSSHMTRVAEIFRTATAKSLVLLDELGAGTDPTEGAALGRAILDEVDRLGCRAMVTTHLGDLKTYALGNSRAENAAVEFDLATLRPTYRLQLGQFGMSNAIQIARRLKLPKTLVSRAYKYLKRRQRRVPELAKLQLLRAEAEKARADALAAQQQAEREREEYETRAAALAKQEREEMALTTAREKLRAGDAVRVARFDKVGRVVRVDLKKRSATVSVGLGQWDIPLAELFPE